ARGGGWRSAPPGQLPAPGRPGLRSTPLRQGSGPWDSLRQQGVALADRVARVDLHGLADRLEPGMLDTDRVAAGPDDVSDQPRPAGLDATDPHLAERLRGDGEE